MTQVTPLEIYRKLASLGLTLEQAVAVTDGLNESLDGGVKQAGVFDLLRAPLNSGIDAAGAAAVAAPFLAYGAGNMLAKKLDDSKANVKDLQEAELISELQQNIDRLRERRRLKESGQLVSP
jgi:hypothetical protein